MKKTLKALKDHGVSEYDLVGLLTTAVEYRLDLDLYDEDELHIHQRDRDLLEALNRLSWEVYDPK